MRTKIEFLIAVMDNLNAEADGLTVRRTWYNGLLTR